MYQKYKYSVAFGKVIVNVFATSFYCSYAWLYRWRRVCKMFLARMLKLNKKTNYMNTDYNSEHKEGPVAKAIEKQTAKIPSDVFLWAAFGSMAVSAILQFSTNKKESLFIGQWAAPFLLLGVYNKLVKQLGHDKEDRSA